jgi:O-antigen ligase
VSFAPEVSANRRFLLLLITGLLGSEVAMYLGVGSLFYTAALVVTGIYVARRSAEALWVGFFLFAVTSQIYPVGLDELGAASRSAYRPYILVVLVVAGSMLVGQLFGRSRTFGRHVSQITGVKVRISAFVAVLFLALAHGYFASMSPPGLVDVLRECSGWMTFLVFLFLGYRLSPSPAETQKSLVRLRLAVLVYSTFFIVKFIYLMFSLGVVETVIEFGYSKRDEVFFSGLVLVLLIAQELTSVVVSMWKIPWLAGFVLISAALLSGSRSLVGSILIVALLLVLLLHPKIRLRLGLVGMVVILIVVFGPSLIFASQGSLLDYITNRFLTISTEDTSLLAHASQWVAVADAVRGNPLLGKGPFASYEFLDPLFGWKETTYLDSGLGYLLMKAGLLGTCVFVWFALGWLRVVQGLRRALPALGAPFLAVFLFYLVFLIFGPSFFEFQHAWFIGLVVGYTLTLASRFPFLKTAQIPGSLDQNGALA